MIYNREKEEEEEENGRSAGKIRSTIEEVEGEEAVNCVTRPTAVNYKDSRPQTHTHTHAHTRVKKIDISFGLSLSQSTFSGGRYEGKNRRRIHFLLKTNPLDPHFLLVCIK